LLRILLAVTALLIYGSLYPWHFHAPQTPGGPLEALLHSWQIPLNRYILRDMALNIAIYVPFGAAAYLWLSSRAILTRLAGPILLAFALSVTIELLQFYDAHRFTSLVDVATNVVGAVLGILLALPVARTRRNAPAIRIRQPGALLLLCCFTGAILFPLIPDLSRTHLAGKLASFSAGSFAPVSFFSLYVGWLVAARLLLALLEQGSEQLVFPLLGFLLPARFLIADLNAPWPYWASFIAGWLTWAACFAGSRRRNVALALLTSASVAATGLAPLHFAAQQSYFEWVPFRALFSTQWGTGFTVFLQKAFLYGSAIWLLRESGVGLRRAAVYVALGLAVIEAVQLYLPNHASESTDPLLALLLAWVLHRLARAVGTSGVTMVSNTTGISCDYPPHIRSHRQNR